MQSTTETTYYPMGTVLTGYGRYRRPSKQPNPSTFGRRHYRPVGEGFAAKAKKLRSPKSDVGVMQELHGMKLQFTLPVEFK